MLKLYDLTIEYKTDPLGLDEVQPRFSWKLESDRNDTRQSAYRITVSNGELLWDSGRVESEQSILIEYMGALFSPRTAYTWTATVWDKHGESASASARFETGLLSGAAFEGRAKWITHGLSKEDAASPVFTKSFPVTKPVRKARLYAAALGLYEAGINGKKVDDTYFTPGWTSYHKRLQYQTCALTLREGENTLRVMLEHPAARPIIRQVMPQMLDNPMIEYVKNEPISSLLAYAAEAKPLYACKKVPLSEHDFSRDLLLPIYSALP